MLLIVTGKTQSGKSTAVERLVRTALQATWAQITIVNGKTGQLMQSTGSRKLRVTPAVEPDVIAQSLTATADRITTRCAAQAGRGAPPAAQRELLVVDEVQEYTRHPKVGGVVRSALSRIFERAAALGDVVILASQRSIGAIPPSARVNAGAELRMLGEGHFQLVATGSPVRCGHVDPAALLARPDSLSVEQLPAALCGPVTPRAPTLVTRYEGLPGSGRTYALSLHRGDKPGLRRVELDVKALAHKALIASCLEQCGATPTGGPAPLLPELVEAAAVALQARPTLLLIDNLDLATPRLIDTLQRLIDASSEAAVALAPPPRNLGRDYAAPIRRRAALVELRPLDRDQAQALVRQVAPAMDEASAQAVVQRADGNPQAIIAFSERVAAHGSEERHRLEGARPPSRWLNLLLMFAMLVTVIFIQRSVAHDLAGAALTAVFFVTMWFIRPRINAAMRP